MKIFLKIYAIPRKAAVKGGEWGIIVSGHHCRHQLVWVAPFDISMKDILDGTGM